MNVFEVCRYAFANQCKVEFDFDANMMYIKVVMFPENTGSGGSYVMKQKEMTQALPLDHMRNEKVKNCIDFMVGKLKEIPNETK